jgi:hypothetical protein
LQVAESCCDVVKPRPTVIVRKRLPPLHFGNGAFGVEIITVDHDESKIGGERLREGAFAAATNTHHDDGWSI